MIIRCFHRNPVFGLAITAILIFSGCAIDPTSQDETISDKQHLFQLREADETGLTFNNELPVELELNIFNYMYYYNGGGIAVADFNNDDLPDIYFTSNLGPERLYLNNGGLQFTDITKLVDVDGGPNSWSTGASVADVNGDGLPDIYLCQVGKYRNLDTRNKLFICTGIDDGGIPAYREAAKEYGLAFKGFSTQAGFFDYDLDGDLDMYLLNHSLHNQGTFGPREKFVNTIDSFSGDKIFRNDGERFTDVTETSGIQSSVIGYGLGLAISDVNFDGYPDVYVGNDFHENDYLYINQQDGTFREEINDQIKHTSRFSMGVDIADINNDHFPEIISLDMMPEDPFILKSSDGEESLDVFNFKLKYGYNYQYARNALQLNNGNNTFSEIGQYAGIHATDWSWSPLLFDMDLDGKRDLFISNGIPKRMNDLDYMDYHSSSDLQYKIQFDDMSEKELEAINLIPEIKLKNKFYIQDENLVYVDAADRIINNKTSYSNSAAYADFDLDGDLDVVVNNINDPAFLYENLNNPEVNEVLRVKLTGSENNRHAVGAKVLVEEGSEIQIAEINPARGFQSSMLGPLYFKPGKGAAKKITVIWPDHTYTSRDVSDIYDLELSHAPHLPKYNFEAGEKKLSYAFKSHESEMGIQHFHKENSFVEFNREPLIPFSTSSDGPALAIGDLNNDGLEDIYVGSSKREVSALYHQQIDGTFRKTELTAFVENKTFEEVDAHIIDINNDGLNDLIIATGGNEYPLGREFTKPLLYMGTTDGSLEFQLSAFDNVFVTASCIEVFDYTGDGYPDLFFGGRAVPFAYGKPASSLLLVNDGQGRFKDLTNEYCKKLTDFGFVNGSCLADMNSDGKVDIVLAVGWNGIHALMQNEKGFEIEKINNEKGWWNFVMPVDADADGKLDIIAGNMGLNHKLKIRDDQPVRMYYDDFDDNGTKEQIVTYFVSGKEVPLMSKKELEKQLPFIKQKFPYAKDFANAAITDIFPKDKLRAYYEVDYAQSALLHNLGEGNFRTLALPAEAQIAPMHAAYVIGADLQNAGESADNEIGQSVDILIKGNYYNANVQLGRFDASYGRVISINMTDDEMFSQQIEGEVIDGQVKEIKPIDVDGAAYLVIAQNNDSLKIVSLEHQSKNRLINQD